MTVKAYKSTTTWRTLEYQDSVLAPVVPGWPNIPVYIDGDKEAMLRPTARKAPDKIYFAALPVLARSEKELQAIVAMAWNRDATLISVEDGTEWKPSHSMVKIFKAWKAAKNNGAAKIGAKISADNRTSATKEAINKIRDRWPQPSGDWPTSILLKEAGISLNTAKSHLGRRPIAQANYEAAQKRKARRQEAGRV